MCDKEIRTFKLIDENGLIKHASVNRDLIDDFQEGELFTGSMTFYGSLLVGDYSEREYFSRKELDSYFEEVFPIPLKQSPTLWDGIAPLEVGMHLSVVNTHGNILEVVKVDIVNKQVLIEEVVGYKWHLVSTDSLVSLKKSHKEETLEKVMKAWKGQGIDCAFDDVKSRVGIKRLFDVVYNVIKSEEK